MKYHALFVIFEKAAKFENVKCCNTKFQDPAMHNFKDVDGKWV